MIAWMGFHLCNPPKRSCFAVCCHHVGAVVHLIGTENVTKSRAASSAEHWSAIDKVGKKKRTLLIEIIAALGADVLRPSSGLQ
jgi:hypothetical protein